MPHKKLLIRVVLLLALFCVVSASSKSGLTTSTVRAMSLEEEYQRDREHIELVGQSKSLSRLRALAGLMERKWRRFDTYPDKRLYFGIIGRVIGEFTSRDFGTDNYIRQYELAHQYARTALQNADKMPLELDLDVAVGFLLPLTFDPSLKYQTAKSPRWAKLRSENAGLFLRLLQRIDAGIDPNFDFTAPPPINDAPPFGVPGWNEMTPGNIKNPEHRAKYEAVKKQNSERRRKFKEQSQLRRVNERFSLDAEKYLIEAYSHAPFDLRQLERLLNNYTINEERKERILAAVRKNMQKAAQEEAAQGKAATP